jgi:hypothetical protein
MFPVGAVCNPRSNVNEKFYGKACKNKDILFHAAEHGIEIPEGTLLPEVYTKLEKLCTGVGIYEPTAEEMAKAESVRVQSEKEGEEHVQSEDVTYVYLGTKEDV